MITILPDGRYLWDGETLDVLSFGPCSSHTPAHQWKYIRKASGEKEIIECPCQQSCSEFDALP